MNRSYRHRRKGGSARRVLGAMGALISLLLLALAALGLITTGAGALLLFSGELPRMATLKEYKPPLVSKVYAEDGTVIGEFFVERRIWVPYEKFPKRLVLAFVAAEDSRFFKHRGIDPWGILRATLKNIQAGAIVQGGSTITQQVAKIILLTPERSLMRKLKEMITALRIERQFTKEEILELYLNQIYLGHGAYGVAQAAETYFNKRLEELSLAEMAILAGLPRAPARYSPINYPQRAKERQRYVLRRMVEDGYITEKEARATLKTPVKFTGIDRSRMEKASYFVEHIRQYLEEKYGTDTLYKGGLSIYTTLDVRLQEWAVDALQEGLRELDARQGFRGPIKQIDPKDAEDLLATLPKREPKTGQITTGVVERLDKGGEVAWVRIPGYRGRLDLTFNGPVRLKAGDVIQVRVGDYNPKRRLVELSIEQEPLVQGALIAIEPKTGYVRAMVGGGDFRKSQFNRAIQAKRQPGSAFKPIIYAAAIDKGFTPNFVIQDEPVSYPGPLPGQYWEPQNYDREFKGPTTLRKALAESRNVVTVRLLDMMGPNYAIDYARRLGITSPLSPYLSMALGSFEVSLLELTRAYATFAAEGVRAEPIFILEVRDKEGRTLERNEPNLVQAISPETAYIMNHMMRGVIEEGTGRAVRVINRPAAGKTGTTDDFADAWFIGYTPQLVAGVWVGYDDRKSLGKGETGARAAAPIWLKFMERALSDKPPEPFPIPENIVFVPIDKWTNQPATMESDEVTLEPFKTEERPESAVP